MTQERREFVKARLIEYDDLPDGAWWAAMEAHGISIEEIAECSETRPCKGHK